MGDCFVLSWPPLGIERMVMRVTRMAQGSSTDWRVRLDCVQDIDGISDTVLAEVPSGWTPPSHDPAPLTETALYELPYFLVGQYVTGDNDSDWADLPAGFGFLATAAAQPAGTTLGFHVLTQDAYGAWTADRSCAFTDYGRLAADIDDVQTSLDVAPGVIYDVDPNEPFLVDDEWMLLTAWDAAGSRITCQRGCMDTVPAAHAAQAVVWLAGFYDNSDPRVYVSGQTAQCRLQPYAANGDLALASCPTRNLAMRGRAGRPVAPANVRVNGTYRPRTLATWAATLAWARRDRQDTARIRANQEGDFAPEDGTTYGVAIREKVFPDSAWYAVHSAAGLPLATVSYDLLDKYTPQAHTLEISLSASLEGLASWQSNVVQFAHSGLPDALSMTTAAPPGGAARGDLYVIPAGATGAWAGRTGQEAKYRGGWMYYQPVAGDRVGCLADSKTYAYDGAEWREEE
jgi:hypothetical protein